MLVFVSLPVLLGALVYGPFILDLLLHRRPPSRLLIPSGYKGWVRIEYGVSTAPPLPREGKFLLLRIATDGTLKTATDLPEGWGHDEFFYVSGGERRQLSNAGWCKGGMIWDEVTGQRVFPKVFEILRRHRGPIPSRCGSDWKDL